MKSVALLLGPMINDITFIWINMVWDRMSKYCTRRTDDDLDHLDPSLPLWDAVQDLYSTDPTEEPCPGPCRLYGSHPATWARSYRPGNRSALKDLDHVVEIDDLSEVWNIVDLIFPPMPSTRYQVSDNATFYLVFSFLLTHFLLPFCVLWGCFVWG